jgi:exopolysaccharide biosynthesis WecB/TagA/CpsF family protein
VVDYGKRNVLGVNVDAVDIDGAVDRIAKRAYARQPYAVTALAVHGIVEATKDPQLTHELNNFDLVAPDGQPVRWALNALHGLDLPEKVPGPTIVERLLAIGAKHGWIVFLYGSTPKTLTRMHCVIEERFDGALSVVSAPSRFRDVDRAELAAIVGSINESRANLCLVGLGCPRQERFVAAAAPHLEMPALAVGAAFDYLAGNITRAPEAMQTAGLEWLYRTVQEPRRLGPRYLTTNSVFSTKLAVQYTRTRFRAPLSVSNPSPAAFRERVDA